MKHFEIFVFTSCIVLDLVSYHQKALVYYVKMRITFVEGKKAHQLVYVICGQFCALLVSY